MVGAAPDTPDLHVDGNTPSSPWTSAVAVSVGTGIYSGVVIAPSHVLTAAHVTGAAAAAAISVHINSGPIPLVLGAKAVSTFPSASFPYDDLAVIELTTPVPANVKSPPIYSTGAGIGQSLILIGYGATGQGDTGPTLVASPTVKRAGRNVLDAVLNAVDASGKRSLFYLFDFDGPAGNGLLGGPTLGNRSESGLAPGDSGSPAYTQVDGEVWLLGINNMVVAQPWNSAVDYQFGTLGGGMLLSDPRFLSWLTAVTHGTLTTAPHPVPPADKRTPTFETKRPRQRP
jgi:hypothetical protein